MYHGEKLNRDPAWVTHFLICIMYSDLIEIIRFCCKGSKCYHSLKYMYVGVFLKLLLFRMCRMTDTCSINYYIRRNNVF